MKKPIIILLLFCASKTYAQKPSITQQPKMSSWRLVNHNKQFSQIFKWNKKGNDTVYFYNTADSIFAKMPNDSTVIVTDTARALQLGFKMLKDIYEIDTENLNIRLNKKN